MKTKGIVAMLALGAALTVLPSSAEARHRFCRPRHHHSGFGVRVYANPYPVYRSYGYGYAADPYYYDDDYGYNGYYNGYSTWGDGGPYPYYSYGRVYREPSIRFSFRGGHRDHRSYRHHRGRR